MWDSKPLPVWNSLFFCLSILARNISPVLHYPPIISKFQLLSKLNLPHFSWNVLVVGTMVLEDKLLPMSLHINTSAFHMHAYTNCHVCLQPQANQKPFLFLQYSFFSKFFLDSWSFMLLFSLPTFFEVWCLWTCYFSWGFFPPRQTWRVTCCLPQPLLLISKPTTVVGISTRHFYFPSMCKLRNTRSFSERY